MAPAAFINPAVIQRTAALVGAEPFRYREGLALRGRAGHAAAALRGAGVLSGTQAAVAAAARARPSVRRRVGARWAGSCPRPGSGRRPIAWRDGSGSMSVDGRTTGGHAVRVDVDAEGHPGYLATARMLGEAGLLLAEPGVDAGAVGMPDAGHRARHRLRGPLRAGPAAVLRQPLSQAGGCALTACPARCTTGTPTKGATWLARWRIAGACPASPTAR